MNGLALNGPVILLKVKTSAEHDTFPLDLLKFYLASFQDLNFRFGSKEMSLSEVQLVANVK